MILVNNNGDWLHTWPILDHASWDGLTLADLVFPSFLLIAGVSIPLALAGQLAKGKTKGQLLQKGAIRALKIFGIGLALNLTWNADWETFRLLGVLQRIGICYLVGVAFYLYLPKWAWWVYIVFSGLLSYFLLSVMDATGTGALYAAADGLVLGAHTYQTSTPLDPEGLLSTLTAIGTILLGMSVGQIRLTMPGSFAKRVAWFGFAIVALGMVVHLKFVPINKTLWTPSFVLVTGGLTVLLLALLSWYEAVRGKQLLPKVFVAAGANPLAIYVLAELGAHLWRYRFMPDRNIKSTLIEAFGRVSPYLYFNSLVYSLCIVSVFLGIGWLLYKKGIVIKV